jgi:hypothetical protein
MAGICVGYTDMDFRTLDKIHHVSSGDSILLSMQVYRGVRFCCLYFIADVDFLFLLNAIQQFFSAILIKLIGHPIQ